MTGVLICVFALAGLSACGDDSDDGDDNNGQHKTCPSTIADNFMGKKLASCDKKAGVCENAESPNNVEYYPCVDDPDCCCDGSAPAIGADLYKCHYDSCTSDGYCDSQCSPAPDPDC